MEEAWRWITDLGNSKIVALLIFFTTFIGILIYVFASKTRSRRLESYKYIPLQDEDGFDEPRADDKDEHRD